jgi:hypothetical protein
MEVRIQRRCRKIVGMSVTAKAIGLSNQDSNATNWLVLNVDDAAIDFEELPLRAPSALPLRRQVPAGHGAYSCREVKTENLLRRTHLAFRDCDVEVEGKRRLLGHLDAGIPDHFSPVGNLLLKQSSERVGCSSCWRCAQLGKGLNNPGFL